jgi:CP family cyanate transporter-like MFS transporter
VLRELQQGTGLSTAATGLLTTVPVLCLGLLAPLAPLAQRRIGAPRVLLACLVLLGLGAFLRTLPGTVLLFGGTILVGAAIAVCNVLLPAVVRQHFPRRTGLMAGLTTMLVTGGAALAGGLTVPLFDWLGHSWRAALASWAVPALVAAGMWLPYAPGGGPDPREPGKAAEDSATATRRGDGPPQSGGSGASGTVWRRARAWQIALFMGIQSLLAYALMAWLPPFLRDHGESAAASGGLLALLSVSSIPTALVVPVLAARVRDRRPIAVTVVACSAAGLAGLLCAPVPGAAVWSCLLGLGQGGELGLALALITLCAGTSARTSMLSSMAQSTGYVLASAGPIVLGAIRSVSGGWTVPLVVLLASTVPMLLFSFLASRPLSESV